MSSAWSWGKKKTDFSCVSPLKSLKKTNGVAPGEPPQPEKHHVKMHSHCAGCCTVTVIHLCSFCWPCDSTASSGELFVTRSEAASLEKSETELHVTAESNPEVWLTPFYNHVTWTHWVRLETLRLCLSFYHKRLRAQHWTLWDARFNDSSLECAIYSSGLDLVVVVQRSWMKLTWPGSATLTAERKCFTFCTRMGFVAWAMT